MNARWLLIFGVMLLGLSTPCDGAPPAATYMNPILRGGYPDPSICRDGDDYYIVNSSFEYFPGLPIHHSTDLVNWELIGYGLHREEQVTGAVNLADVQSNGGIHAPTLRCRDGRFYLITTHVYTSAAKGAKTEFVNFVLTADDPRGPWSEPRVLEGAPGIDPDLFFDDDGRVWYVGTHSPEAPNFPGEGEIWLQEIDPEHWRLVGERHFLWRGACGGVWAEGPHLYKRDGRYYLMIAEGGTSLNHAVMIAVSDEITGPYQSNPRNPILTSRHLSYDHWVNSTGHGDLFELPDGRWYMVALGIRNEEQRHSNMGRETHLLPVEWEREPFEWKEPRYEWPVAAPAKGRVEQVNPAPFEGRAQRLRDGFEDEFEGAELKLDWNFRRVPVPGLFSLAERPGYLRLAVLPTVPADRGRASLLGVRQTESEFSFSTRLEFQPARDNVHAGISIFQKDDRHIDMTVFRAGEQYHLRLTLVEPGFDTHLRIDAALPDYAGHIVLRLVSLRGAYQFDYSVDGGQTFSTFTQTSADHLLAHGSYTGAYLGLYATSLGVDSGEFADFDWVQYRAYPD